MPRKRLRTLMLTGVAVVVPLAVSAWVLLAVIRFVGSLLDPVGGVLRSLGVRSTVTVVLIQGASLLVLLVVLVLVGALARREIGRRGVATVDSYLADVPGLGSVYQTARQMSDLLLAPGDGDDGARFREVKLVEFPGRETYTLAFLTSQNPPAGVVRTARELAGDPDADYRTLFLPMAPNPVMGGHLTHIPADRVHDVDIDLEDAMQYILTMGVVDDSGEPADGHGESPA